MSATPKTTGAASGSDANNAGSATINGETMSAADVKFVLGFLSSFAKKPEMNWDAMATNMGISKKSAIERWRIIRIKYKIEMVNPELPAAASGEPKTPGTGRKARKPKGAAAETPKDGDNNEDGGETLTPTKKKRATPAKNRAALTAAAEYGGATDNEDDGENDVIVVAATPTKSLANTKKRATPAKKRAAAAAAEADETSEEEEQGTPAKKAKVADYDTDEGEAIAHADAAFAIQESIEDAAAAAAEAAAAAAGEI